MCHDPKCDCQKQINFTPKRFHFEGGSIKIHLKSIFKGTRTAWNKFLKPALNMASPYFGMEVGAKTKYPKVDQATTNILKSLTGGKISSLTDMHGNGICLKIM